MNRIFRETLIVFMYFIILFLILPINCVTYISTPAVVNGTITLDTLATYQVISSLRIIEVNNNQPLIHITHSGVTLDLNGQLIEGLKTKSGNIGIKIDSGLSDIAILNGTIKNCSGKGLEINNGCFNIKLDNVTFQSVLSPAMSIDNGGSITLNNVSIETIYPITNPADYILGTYDTIGLYLYETAHTVKHSYRIKDMRISHLLVGSNAKNCVGLFANGIQNLFIDYANITDFTGTAFVIGVYAKEVKVSKITHLTIEGMYATGDLAPSIGIKYDSCEDCSLKDALIFGNKSEHSSIGIEWDETANLIIEQTRVSQNYGKDISYGIKGNAGSHNLLSKVSIIGNRSQFTVLDEGLVVGIGISGFEEVSQIIDSDISLQAGLGRCFGIVLSLDYQIGDEVPFGILIDNNKIYNNIAYKKCYGYRDFSPYNPDLYSGTSVLTNNVAHGQGPVFKKGCSNVTLLKYMNYYSEAIVANSTGMINEISITTMNEIIRLVKNGSPLNVSYVFYEEFKPFLRKRLNRIIRGNKLLNVDD